MLTVLTCKLVSKLEKSPSPQIDQLDKLFKFILAFWLNFNLLAKVSFMLARLVFILADLLTQQVNQLTNKSVKTYSKLV